MPTLEHNSLLAWIGRRRPELFNSRGNAFSSLFRAWLVTEEPGQPAVKAEHDQSDVVSTFLFIQDAPIVTQVRSYYTGATGTFVLPEIDFDEWQLLPTGESAMAADILAADKPVFDACEVMTGATVTNGVEVQGYYVGINIRNRGIELEEEPATCKLNMSLWSKGAVMEGPTWYTIPSRQVGMESV